jgi:superfamily I DNA/RNA helicase
VPLTKLTPQQEEIITMPLSGSCFLEGPAGTGKTTTAVQRLLHMIHRGIPPESILIVVPQRTLGAPYSHLLRQPELPAGGMANVVTLGGLGQRLIDLFWPMIASAAGFARPDRPPTFLTLETAQYYMARLVEPLFEEGYFDSVKIDRNRLYSQIIDNLNKAASVGFDHATFAERLQSAWIGDPVQLRVYAEAQEVANRFRHFCLESNLLDFSLQLEVFARHLWPSILCRQYLTNRYQHLIYDNIEEISLSFTTLSRNGCLNFNPL